MECLQLGCLSTTQLKAVILTKRCCLQHRQCLGGGDELGWGTGSDQVEGREPAAQRALPLASCLTCDEEPK